MIQVKRVYEAPSRMDGLRVLVCRLWPRGLTKERAAVDLWLKELGPSTELRKWFNQDLTKWKEFQVRFRKELREQTDALRLLKQKSKEHTVTLMYGARDEEHNGALVVKRILEAHPRTAKQPVVVLTIGHSTHTLADFLHLLQAHGVTRLVDVRTIPRSRHNPQFNKETLPAALRSAGLSYQHVAGLGGLRHARSDSPNKAWRNLSFRGYADYMQTPEFRGNLQALMDLARKQRVALMCAEALPWRCHRSMIADALVAWGFDVEHIMSATHCQKHVIRPWAIVKRKRVTYPLAPDSDHDTHTKIQTKQQSRIYKGDSRMSQSLKVGDQVGWNSEAGRVRGTIKKKLTSAIKFKGYTVRASKDNPQYLIKSNKTDHMAMHKRSALRKISKGKG